MSGTVGSIGGSGGSSNAVDTEYIVLCDDRGGGNIVKFLRKYKGDALGNTTYGDFQLDAVTAFTPTGTVKECPSTSSVTDECFTPIFDGAGYASGDRLLRLCVWDLQTSPATLVSTTWFNQNTGAALATAPTLFHLRPCDTELVYYSACYRALVSGTGFSVGDTLLVTRIDDYTNIGAPLTTGITYYNVSRGTVFDSSTQTLIVGQDMEPCDDNAGAEFKVLCDTVAGVKTRFLRRYTLTKNGTVTVTDTTIDGVTAYTPTGAIENCDPCGPVEILCDDNGAFLRHFDCDGGAAVDTTLDGVTAYTPTGTVKNCTPTIITKPCMTCR